MNNRFRYILFRFLNLLRENGHTRPAVVRPQSVEEGQRNVFHFSGGAHEWTLQVPRVADGQLPDADANDQEARGQFAVREQVVDL